MLEILQRKHIWDILERKALASNPCSGYVNEAVVLNSLTPFNLLIDLVVIIYFLAYNVFILMEEKLLEINLKGLSSPEDNI